VVVGLCLIIKNKMATSKKVVKKTVSVVPRYNNYYLVNADGGNYYLNTYEWGTGREVHKYVCYTSLSGLNKAIVALKKKGYAELPQ